MKQYTGVYEIDASDMNNQEVAIRAELVRQNNIEQQRLKLLNKQIKQEKEYQEKLLEQQEAQYKEQQYRERCNQLGISYDNLKMFLDKTVGYKEDPLYKSAKQTLQMLPLIYNQVKLKDEYMKAKQKYNNIKWNLGYRLNHKDEYKAVKEEYKEVEEKYTQMLIKENLKDEDLLTMEKYNKYKEQEEAYVKEVEEKYSQKEKEFNEFRKTHFNEEIEILFKQLELNLEPIKDIKEKGTKQDYIDYINRKILEG